MDKSWRSKARLVAYFEAVILGLSISLVVILAVVLYIGTFLNFETHEAYCRRQHKVEVHYVFNQDQDEVHQYWVVVEVQIRTSICWIAYIIFVVATGVRFWIFIGLSKATATQTTPKEGLHRAKTWRNVTTGLLFLESLIYFSCLIAVLFTVAPFKTFCFLLLVSFGLDIGVKCGCLAVVNKFINELELEVLSLDSFFV